MGRSSGYKFAQGESWIGKMLRRAALWYRALLIRVFLNPKNCLDVGCGTGELVRTLRQSGIDAYGVEISDQALELADKSIQPYLKKGDITKLPYKKDQFDLVLTFDVLEHVERSKIKIAIDETIRVSSKFILHKIYTRENAWIRWFHGKDYSHVSVFTKKFWQQLFTENRHAALQRNSIFRLPVFMESIFLLKKK